MVLGKETDDVRDYCDFCGFGWWVFVVGLCFEKKGLWSKGMTFGLHPRSSGSIPDSSTMAALPQECCQNRCKELAAPHQLYWSSGQDAGP